MKQQSAEKILLILPLVLFASLYLPMVPPIVIFSLLIVSHLLFLNKYENIFLLSLFTPLYGIYFNLNGIPFVGGTIMLLIFLTMFFQSKIYIIKFQVTLFYILFIILILFISVIYTTGGDYAGTKLLTTLQNVIYYTMAFSYLFYYIEKMNYYKISIFILSLVLFSLIYSLIFFEMAGPKNLFDFAFFRLNEFKESTVMINYQSLGLNLCIALSFLLARKNITLSTKILLIVLLFLTTLYTGSRQSIFGFLLIVFVGYYLSRKKKYLLFLLIVAAIYLVLVYWFIVYMKIELFNVLIKSDNLIEASGRSNLIDRGIELFKQSPLFGVGYGRYSINSTYKIYPHNIFIELLCELGIIGSIAIWSSFLMPFRKVIAIAKENKFSSLLIMLLLSFFVRALVSSDFSTNIQIFALLFSVLIVKQHAKLPNRLNSRQVLIIKERKHDILMESSIR